MSVLQVLPGPLTRTPLVGQRAGQTPCCSTNTHTHIHTPAKQEEKKLFFLQDGQWGEGGVSQASLRQGVRGTPQTSFHVTDINYYYHHYSILQTLYQQRDPHHKSVVKTRRCFLWNRQYFQLDLFTDCTDRYIINRKPTLYHSVAMLCCTKSYFPYWY